MGRGGRQTSTLHYDSGSREGAYDKILFFDRYELHRVQLILACFHPF